MAIDRRRDAPVRSIDGQQGFIYLNNAASSWPKPQEVLEAVAESLRSPYAGEGRTSFGEAVNYPDSAREALGWFLHFDPPEHVVFTQNATDSLNLLIHGYVRAEGGRPHVITTALEHNSVLRPLHTLVREGAIDLTVVPFRDHRVDPAELKNAIRPETRLVVMTHGSNVLGSVQDIGAIGRYLEENDIFFVVDGAQTAGHIPVDLSRTPVDAFVFTGHKGLFGLPGIGGFTIRSPDRVVPVRQGGTGTESRSLVHPEGMPERFEAGTPNYPGMASLIAGVRFLESVGLEKVERKGKELTGHLIRSLRKEPNIIICNETPDLPLVSFNIEGLDCDTVGYILGRGYRLIVRTGLHCAPLVHQAIDGGRGCVRLSLSWFTTREECETAADAICEVARGADSQVSTP
jgi:cysteine desulfurase family protein